VDKKRIVIQLACDKALHKKARKVAYYKGQTVSGWIRSQVISAYNRLPEDAK